MYEETWNIIYGWTKLYFPNAKNQQHTQGKKKLEQGNLYQIIFKIVPAGLYTTQKNNC